MHAVRARGKSDIDSRVHQNLDSRWTRRLHGGLHQMQQFVRPEILLTNLNPIYAGEVPLNLGEAGTAGNHYAEHRFIIKGCMMKMPMIDERQFYKESNTTKPALLNCPYCRSQETYELRWLVRKKIDRLPGHADDRDRAKFAKSLSYMVLLDDKASCKNVRCRKPFDISGIKTTAFI